MCDKVILKNAGMLLFIPDHLKDQNICNKAFDDFTHALGSVPNCYKTQKMCDKAFSIYPSTIQFLPDQFKTQEMCDKAVNTCPFVFDSIPDRYMSQKLWDKVVFEDPFMLKHFHDRYKAQEVCDKAVDSYLLPLKLILDWFVTNKINEQLDNAVFSNDYIAVADLDSDFVTFFSKKVGLNSIALDNINLDGDHFGYCDPETINDVIPVAWRNKYKQRKASKKDRWRITAPSMASNKMVGLVPVRKWKKRNW